VPTSAPKPVRSPRANGSSPPSSCAIAKHASARHVRGAISLGPAPAVPAPTRKAAHATKKPRRDGDDRDFVAVVPTSTKK